MCGIKRDNDDSAGYVDMDYNENGSVWGSGYRCWEVNHFFCGFPFRRLPAACWRFAVSWNMNAVCA